MKPSRFIVLFLLSFCVASYSICIYIRKGYARNELYYIEGKDSLKDILLKEIEEKSLIEDMRIFFHKRPALKVPEKVKKKDAAQTFYCFTAELWCDTENGELPFTTWSDPENPRKKKTEKYIKDIAAEQPIVFCTSTDYYTYRVGRKKEGVFEGIVIRNGELLYEVPAPVKKRYSFPTYDTLALFADGHVESWQSAEKKAEQYLKEGAVQVYTFGPCLVRDGELTEFVTKLANRKLNPRHAFGVVEPGHYIDVICEGRLAKTNGSTGVMMENLAQIMIDRGCTLAVNLDGGQTAVMAFLGKQLNAVQKSEPYGRKTYEVLSFGKRSE